MLKNFLKKLLCIGFSALLPTPRQTPSNLSPRPRSSRLGSAAINPTYAALRRKNEIRELLEERANELYQYYSHELSDALIKVTKATLESLRKRIHVTLLHVYKDPKTSILDEKDDTGIAPIFQSYFVLKIPNVCMSPSLEEIQKCTNQCVNEIVSVSKGVFKWDPILPNTSMAVIEEMQRFRSDSFSQSVEENFPLHHQYEISEKRERRNFYRIVIQNKEINKLISSLLTIINSQKNEMAEALEHYSRYSHVWLKDRQSTIELFLTTNPNIDHFEQAILYYKEIERMVENEEERTDVGSVALYTGKRTKAEFRGFRRL